MAGEPEDGGQQARKPERAPAPEREARAPEADSRQPTIGNEATRRMLFGISPHDTAREARPERGDPDVVDVPDEAAAPRGPVTVDVAQLGDPGWIPPPPATPAGAAPDVLRQGDVAPAEAARFLEDVRRLPLPPRPPTGPGALCEPGPDVWTESLHTWCAHLQPLAPPSAAHRVATWLVGQGRGLLIDVDRPAVTDARIVAIGTTVLAARGAETADLAATALHLELSSLAGRIDGVESAVRRTRQHPPSATDLARGRVKEHGGGPPDPGPVELVALWQRILALRDPATWVPAAFAPAPVESDPHGLRHLLRSWTTPTGSHPARQALLAGATSTYIEGARAQVRGAAGAVLLARIGERWPRGVDHEILWRSIQALDATVRPCHLELESLGRALTAETEPLERVRARLLAICTRLAEAQHAMATHLAAATAAVTPHGRALAPTRDEAPLVAALLAEDRGRALASLPQDLDGAAAAALLTATRSGPVDALHRVWDRASDRPDLQAVLAVVLQAQRARTTRDPALTRAQEALARRTGHPALWLDAEIAAMDPVSKEERRARQRTAGATLRAWGAEGSLSCLSRWRP